MIRLRREKRTKERKIQMTNRAKEKRKKRRKMRAKRVNHSKEQQRRKNISMNDKYYIQHEAPK